MDKKNWWKTLNFIIASTGPGPKFFSRKRKNYYNKKNFGSCLTLKGLKEILNNLPKEYDNYLITINSSNKYSEYTNDHHLVNYLALTIWDTNNIGMMVENEKMLDLFFTGGQIK